MKLTAYRQIKDAFYADLEAVFAKHGLAASKINAGIEEALGTVRLSIQLRDVNQTDATGKGTTPEAERFKQYAGAFGLKPEWLGTNVKMGATEYSVVGLKGGRATKCVMLKSATTGKMHVADPAVVRHFVERSLLCAGAAI